MKIQAERDRPSDRLTLEVSRQSPQEALPQPGGRRDRQQKVCDVLANEPDRKRIKSPTFLASMKPFPFQSTVKMGTEMDASRTPQKKKRHTMDSEGN